MANESSDVSGRVNRWWRDPLVLFLAIGADLFALDRSVGPGDVDDPVIEVTDAQLTRIREVWTIQAGRPPSDAELQTLLDETAREEILYREARRLGLDRDDAIVRRRLAQKMTFMLEDTVEVSAPSNVDVDAFHAEHTDRYREPRRTTFMHVFFGAERRQDSTGDARTALRALERKGADTWRQAGDPFMLLREYADCTDQEIAQLFGGRFAIGIAAFGVGTWQGPVESVYGMHLVRVVRRDEPRALDDIRAEVADDIRAARRRELNDASFKAVRRRYDIRVPETTADGR